MRLDPHKYDGSILLAVSGGVDSVVMARLMHHGNIHRQKLSIAHCNFHLRGAESDEDEMFVRSLADELHMECHVRDFDTASYASEHGVSIEMAARELRYRWFDELCREHGYSGVCVAHNANDNAETLILNLLRGTGLNGIKAMAQVSRNPYGTTNVYRPMLDYSRAQIEAWAVEKGVKWRTDSTNLQNDCKRNIIRNEIFPLFAKINPSYIDTLCRDIRNFRLGNTQMVEDMLAAGFNGSTIEDAIALLEGEGTISGKTFHSKTHTMVMGADGYRIVANDAPTQNQPRISLIDWKEGMNTKVPVGTSLLDASKIEGEPVLRKWRAGDYMRPIGLKGRKKVSDILTELGLDVLQKENVMVVEGDGSHVLCVVGYRTDDIVKITASTSKVWVIELTQ